MKNWYWTIALLLTMAMGAPCQDRPARWSAAAPGKALQPGAKFSVQLSAEITSGWHVYSTTQPPGGPTTTVITVPSTQPFKLAAPIIGPPPHTAYDTNFEMNTETYEDRAEFNVPIAVTSYVHPGDQKLTIDVRFQVCNDTTCMPATTEHIIVPVKVEVPKSTAPAASKPVSQTNHVTPSAPQLAGTLPPTVLEKTSQTAGSAVHSGTSRQSFGSFLWLAFVMGALSLLTPCVFPMIPMTVSYFVNQSGASRRSAINSALLYGLGIILTFTALGLLLAIIFGAGGVNKLAANPWVNLLITAIFFGFAFSLFGTYFIQVPTSLTNKLNSLTRRKEGSRVVGALLMGSTFTLTSFTCTAPFVGTLLVMTAQGNWRWPLAGMLVFSTVFAVPFFLLALAPRALAQMPKSGTWMISVKVVVGLLEIAAAMKFLSNADLVWHWGIFTRQVVLATWVGIGILTIFYLLGFVRTSHEEAVESIGAGRLVLTVIALASTIWMIPGLFGRQLGALEAFLPPEATSSSFVANAQAQPNAETDVQWMINDYEGALARAKQENKSVFIDFTGYTCTNCRWMESNMFPRPEISRELKRYICVRLYTDGDGAVFQHQQNLQQTKFGTVALPFYAVLSPDGSVTSTFPGLTKSESEFLNFLMRKTS